MYDENQSVTERTRQEEYMKVKISEAFNLFVKDKKGFVDKRYLIYVISVKYHT
jgi:Ca2+-binding EF-hand superfamily protein